MMKLEREYLLNGLIRISKNLIAKFRLDPMRFFRYWTPLCIFNNFMVFLDQRKNPDHPWLTKQANSILSTLLKQTDEGLEWGSGRSTFWLAQRIKHLTSVEHDKEWYEAVSSKLKAANISNVNYLLCKVTEEKTKESNISVTAMGPLGMVYSSAKILPDERHRLAKKLVDSAKVPLVLVADGPDRLRAWTKQGEFVLPEQKEKVLGPDHPFLDEVTRDLIELCQHPDAGDFIICGWRTDGTPYSFPIENGAHGGPGSEETKAFALLPGDTSLPERNCYYLRPMDVRRAAFHLLGRSEIKISTEPYRKATDPRTLRIMTYNIHSCIGMDGKISPERIARVIAQCSPDVVALQELDVGRARTDRVDQADLIAQYLQMDYHFLPTTRVRKGRYGNAVLTHFPIRLVRADKLPGLPGKPQLEPRGGLWVAIKAGGTEIQFINTHLGLRPKERHVQAEALLGSGWLSHPDCREPTILCGDFNALPSSRVWRRLCTLLRDTQVELAGHCPKKTLFGRFPFARIDHVFVDPAIEVIGIEVPNTELTRVASDHLPLIVEVRIPKPFIKHMR